MSTKVAGAISFSVSEVNYDITDSITYSVGGWRRETVTVLSGAPGYYKETAVPSRIAVTILDSRGNSLADWQAMEDVSVIAHFANGKTISGSGMYVTEVIEVDAQNATFSVVFEGAANAVTES